MNILRRPRQNEASFFKNPKKPIAPALFIPLPGAANYKNNPPHNPTLHIGLKYSAPPELWKTLHNMITTQKKPS